MYFTNKELSDVIANALEESKVSFDKKTNLWEVKMPQIDSESYAVFKKILSEIHGKWKRGLNAHVFECDPTELIEEILAVGRIPEKNPHDAFFTQKETLECLLDWGNFYCLTSADGKNTEPDKCLEPSAGQGHIVEVLREMYPGIDLSCCEIDLFNRIMLKKKGFSVIAEDFLTAKIEPVYDWVVMNPPFNGTHGDYIDHINKAFDEALMPRGRLLAIVPTSFLRSTTKRVEDFRNKIAIYGEWANLPEGSFKKSGTQIDTCMIKMEKYTEEDLEKFETPGQMYGTYDTYTGPIVRDLSSDSNWSKKFQAVIADIKKGRLKSQKEAYKSLIDAASPLVNLANLHHESSYRWDELTQTRFAEFFWDDIVEDYFDGRSPFENIREANTAPIQLSLFG